MVYLPEADILMDRFEVTDGEFEIYVKATDRKIEPETGFLSHWVLEPSGFRPSNATDPVRNVSLNDAKSYAEFVNKSLPTHEEWIASSRGIAQGVFPWPPKSQLEEVCNVFETGLVEVSPVGVFEGGKSESGCYDLIGNVAEWTDTQVASRIGPIYVVRGGSFNQSALPKPGPRTEVTSSVLATQARAEELEFLGTSEQARERVGLEFRHRDERNFDIGFRCIIRNAQEVLEAALDHVLTLKGEARTQAIRELLLVGEPRRGANRVLALVAEREFRSRVIWSHPTSSLIDMQRSPVSIRRGWWSRGEEFLMIQESALEFRAAASGEVIQSVDLRDFSNSFPRHGVMPPKDDRAWFWISDSQGRVSVVSLPDGERLDLSNAMGAEDRVYLDPTFFRWGRQKSDLCAVQPYVAHSPESDLVGPEVLAEEELLRVLMMDSETPRQVSLPGRLHSSQRINDHLLLLSVGDESYRQNHFPVQSHSLIDLRRGEIVGSRSIRVTERQNAELMPMVPATLPRDGHVMVASGVRQQSEATILVSVEVLRASDLASIRRRQFEFALLTQIVATDLPGTYGVISSTGQPSVITLQDQEIVQIEIPVPTESTPWQWLRGDDRRDQRVAPFLVPSPKAYGEVAVLGIRESRESGWSVETLLQPETLDGAVTSILETTPAPKQMIIVQRTGAWAAQLDLRTKTVLWQAPLPQASSLSLDRLRAGEEELEDVVVGSSTKGIWWCSMNDGRRVDGFEVRGGVIADELLVDVNGDSNREWVLHLRDQRVLGDAAVGVGPALVAVGKPEPEAALLLREFQGQRAPNNGGE